MTIKWIDWVKQIQSIAQAGLTYSKDVYDIERFQRITRYFYFNDVTLHENRLGSRREIICK